MTTDRDECAACQREQHYLAQGFESSNIIVLGHTCEDENAHPYPGMKALFPMAEWRRLRKVYRKRRRAHD